MFRANSYKRSGERVTAKATQRISTEQQKRMSLSQLVPHLFEPNSLITSFFGPKQRDHFAEDAHPSLSCRRFLDDVAYDRREANGVRGSFHHELRKSFCRIQRYVASGGRGLQQVQSPVC